jgi:hypothetical protein
MDMMGDFLWFLQKWDSSAGAVGRAMRRGIPSFQRKLESSGVIKHSGEAGQMILSATRDYSHAGYQLALE